jgi:hypothetical protein
MSCSNGIDGKTDSSCQHVRVDFGQNGLHGSGSIVRRSFRGLFGGSRIRDFAWHLTEYGTQEALNIFVVLISGKPA